MGSRKLSDLHPAIQIMAARFLDECKRQEIDILVTCTYRSGAEQNRLYAQGRTEPGAKVTNCRAGESNHNFTINGLPASKAFDVVPMRNGKCVWGTKGEDGKLWETVGLIGESVGLSWAGRWKSFKEFPHFEIK